MFAVGQHPILIRAAQRCPGVYVVSFADNISGDMSQCFAMAQELIPTMKEDLHLDVQVKSSWVHVLAWTHLACPPVAYATFLEGFQCLAGIPLKLQGAVVLGCPLGTSAFCTSQANETAAGIAALYPLVQAVPDGSIHFQLVKFCLHTKFQ